MQPSPHDCVISEEGVITELARKMIGGWTTRPGGWIPDDELHTRWRILTPGLARHTYTHVGAPIDPPAPATKHVPWHEAAGRRLPDGTRIMRVEHDVTRSPVLVLANCEHHDVDTGGTVEVLA